MWSHTHTRIAIDSTNEEKFPWCHFHFSFQFQFFFHSFFLSSTLVYLTLKTFAFQKEWRNRCCDCVCVRACVYFSEYIFLPVIRTHTWTRFKRINEPTKSKCCCSSKKTQKKKKKREKSEDWNSRNVFWTLLNCRNNYISTERQFNVNMRTAFLLCLDGKRKAFVVNVSCSFSLDIFFVRAVFIAIFCSLYRLIFYLWVANVDICPFELRHSM